MLINNSNGVLVSDIDEVEGVFLSYFNNIFTSSGTSMIDIELVTEFVKARLLE